MDDTDYLSRKAIVKNLTDGLKHYEGRVEILTYRIIERFMEYIKEFPAAAVQPVKHGRWIETHISLCKWIPEDEKEEGHSFYMAEMKCSYCERYNTKTFSLTLEKPDFCQHCGARMDGDAE